MKAWWEKRKDWYSMLLPVMCFIAFLCLLPLAAMVFPNAVSLNGIEPVVALKGFAGVGGVVILMMVGVAF